MALYDYIDYVNTASTVTSVVLEIACLNTSLSYHFYK